MCIRDSLYILNHIMHREVILTRITDKYIKWRFRYIAIIGLVMFGLVMVIIQWKANYSFNYHESISNLHSVYEEKKQCTLEDFYNQFRWQDELPLPLVQLREHVFQMSQNGQNLSLIHI
eukprot:TRINITY_DN2340_c0_g1_i2.p1 TRINITY_DN2340_c0_g1~~TRINITY_DN2340_c0_g1_i2.p1  ORF type:complete len:119 (-),score=16.24 TRINITY_DN2340_c0_g1_i2:4-360(-)